MLFVDVCLLSVCFIVCPMVLVVRCVVLVVYRVCFVWRCSLFVVCVCVVWFCLLWALFVVCRLLFVGCWFVVCY